MKDYSKEMYEEGRPGISASEGIEFCLDRLYMDRQHVHGDLVAEGLTYEELIGALLVARDSLAAQAANENDDDE